MPNKKLKRKVKVVKQKKKQLQSTDKELDFSSIVRDAEVQREEPEVIPEVNQFSSNSNQRVETNYDQYQKIGYYYNES